MQRATSVVLAACLLGCYIPVQQAQPGGYAQPAQPGFESPAPDGEAAPAPSPEQAAPAPAQPQTFSLSLHNSCRETVNLFVGERPPFSSGTYTTIGANTTTSRSGFAPETIWIVDGSRNPVSSYSVGPGSQRVEILESCTGFASR